MYTVYSINCIDSRLNATFIIYWDKKKIKIHAQYFIWLTVKLYLELSMSVWWITSLKIETGHMDYNKILNALETSTEWSFTLQKYTCLPRNSFWLTRTQPFGLQCYAACENECVWNILKTSGSLIHCSLFPGVVSHILLLPKLIKYKHQTQC